VLWRRVVEVAGGGWERAGATWRDSSLTYFVSVSCMHCDRPICVEVCPTKAMTRGSEDGIVAVDPLRCMGCRYCEWACPYGAPQLDAATGVMTKCDLCRDLLAEGRDPACVTACPMRVLAVEDLAEDGTRGADTYPLPPADLTKPRTAITLHPDAARARDGTARIANDEEL
jgi:anaerobic dimethyl sulfoxide reductase subunit B (iron-sulfur subunit)